ncbi:MAG TPA: lipoyl synthase, partial [Polyangiaceae bacterium]|nr:lipoyl synthase [Polyangiaceae bacterium]
SYAVLTMVDRDDLLDGGAEHVAATVRALKRRRPEMLIETLVGDFRGQREAVASVISARPDVFAHNLEVTRALTPAIRDARCSYDRSLDVLRIAKEEAPERLTKSSLMVGLGETDDEVLASMADLREAGVDIVTVGQYLRPSPRHAAVERYVTPEQFAAYEREGQRMGFRFVASGPLVRSSYHAAEGFVATLAQRPQEGVSRPVVQPSEDESASDASASEPLPPLKIRSRSSEPPPQLIRATDLVRR